MKLEYRMGLYAIAMVLLFVIGLCIFVWNFQLEIGPAIFVKILGLNMAWVGTRIRIRHFSK